MPETGERMIGCKMYLFTNFNFLTFAFITYMFLKILDIIIIVIVMVYSGFHPYTLKLL